MTKYRERMITRIAQAMKNNSILRYLVYAADTVSHTTTREKKKRNKNRFDQLTNIEKFIPVTEFHVKHHVNDSLSQF